MKLVYALALLIASVTVFGATAQRSPIENELEELDLLLNLHSGDYALDGLVSTIRAGLQRVLDRVKAKLGEHKELFEQFRAKIEEVQEKIRGLVKQGGTHLAQLVGQIREKLQALIKGVFDKIQNNAEFYEAEEEEKSVLQRIVERVKQLVQSGLDRLKERVSKFKDIAEQLKDKFAEIQEKVKEVGKDFSIKALDRLNEVREKLRDLIREVTQKITDSLKGSQYVAYGVEELQDLLPTIKTYVFSDEGFATIKNFAKTVQSSNPIVNFVKLFVNSQSDEYLKTVLAELFSNADYAAEYAMPVEAFQRVRDILVTPEGVQAIRKFGNELDSTHQIVTQVAGLLRSVPDAELVRVINELFNGLISSQYESLDQDIAEYYEGESLLEIIGQRLRELAQKALESLKKRVAQAKDVSQLVKEKLQVLQEQIAQLGKEAGAKAVRLFQQIRENIIEVLKGIQAKISDESALYEAEEEQGSLISRIAKRVADLAQRALNKLREKLSTHKEFFEQLRTKFAEVQAKIAELSKTVGAKALEVAKSLREKVRDLAKQIKEKLAGVTYAAEEEQEDKPLLTLIAQRIRAIVERILVVVKAKVAESKELLGEFKDKIDEVSAQLAELGKQTGQKALDAARALREKVRALNKAIVQSIKDKISGSLYAAEDEEEDQSIGELIKQKIQQIVERIRAVVQRVLDTLKVKLGESKELLGQFRERVDEIASGLKELSKKSAQQALQAIAELRRKVLDLARDIKKSVTGEAALYEAEEVEEEVEQSLVQRVVQRVRALVQRVLQKVKETLANREQIASQVKDKIAEITQKLAELAKEKGAKALKAVQELRQKLRDLVKNIRDRIAGQGSYAADDDDEEVDETNPSLIKRLVDRTRRIIERAVERLQQRLSTQKEVLAEFKDKIDAVNQGLAELAKQSGRKALDAARELRRKVEELTRAVIARITGKGALYSAEDEEEDQSIGQLIEKKLRQIAERVRAVVQRVLDTLKEKLGESKELVAKFGERIQAIKTGLTELTKKGAKEALLAVAELRRKVFDLARDITKSITGEVSFYESDEVEIEEPSTTLVQRIVQRVRALVQRVLQKVKETLANRQQIATQVKDKITEITKKLAELAKEKGAKALEAVQVLRQKLRDLVKTIREKISPQGYNSYGLREDLITIRDIVTRPAGLQRLKAYLNNLETSHPTVALVRAYVQATSDDELLVILKEFFSGFDGIILQDYPVTELAQLFANVRKEILTDEGIQKLRDYARNIETSHPVVSRIKSALETRPTDAVRAFLEELFSGLDY